MILERFKIKFQGDLTDNVKHILKDKTNNFDFSRVSKMCVKITTSKDFLLHEMNDIVQIIEKTINIKLKIEMQILIDSEYTNGLKTVEVLTSNTIREWEKDPFLSFVGEK